MSTTPADWSKRGITFLGGSRDGQDLDFLPVRESLSLSNRMGGEEFVELYQRTAEARGGRTVYRFVHSHSDLSP